MRRVVLTGPAAVIAAFGFLLASTSTAQQAKPLQFEVATIKPGHQPSDPQLGVSRSDSQGSQLRMVNMPLKQWVEMGLSVRDYALRAPAWLDTARFDLSAKLPADKPVTQEAKAEMMKSLLIERFSLKWHEESQTVSGYLLVPEKKVLVQPATMLERLRARGSGSGPTLISGTNMSMSEFVGMLGSALGKPVADATNLSGGYDFKLTWRPSDEAELARQQQYGKQFGSDVDNLPGSIFDAVRQQLGLRLQSAKVPFKVIVIDHINTQPTSN